MNKLSWKAIIAGSAVDIIGTNIVLFIYMMIFMFSSGVLKNPAVSNTDLSQLFVDQNLYQGFAIAAFMSVPGGLITAVIARKHELLNSLAAFFLTVTVAFLLKHWVSSGVHFPDWFRPLGYIIAPFSYLSGGYIGSLINRKRTDSLGLTKSSKFLPILFFTLGLIVTMVILIPLAAGILLGYSSTKNRTTTLSNSFPKLESVFAEKLTTQSELDVSKPLVWGYYFYDHDKNKLEAFGKKLEAEGFHIYPIERGAIKEDNDYLLYITEKTVHTPKTLFDQNNKLANLAAENRIEVFDGWEVGKEDRYMKPIP